MAISQYPNDPSCWQLLGIAPTQDRALIRRAYALLVKENHPEDDAEGFHRLRSAYEWAIEQTKRETSKEPKLDTNPLGQITSQPALENTLGPASEIFDYFWQQARNDAHSEAIDALEAWWFLPSQTPAAQKQFNRLLLDAVLDKGMPHSLLNQLVWRIYWRADSLNFQVDAPPQRRHALRQRFLQAVQKSLWQIRLEFAASIANGQAEAGLKILQALFASRAFDHLEKRQMLRVILLRFIAGNPHVSREILAELNNIFQFGAFSHPLSEADLKAIQILDKKLSEKGKS